MRGKIFRNFIFCFVVFIILSIQVSNVFAILGVNPDILLLLVILHSIYYGEYKGEIFGFIIGLLEDVLSGTLFGINAFILTLIAWLTSIYKKYVFVSDAIAFIIYIVLATIFKYILYIIFHLIFSKSNYLDWFYLLKMAGEIFYNSVIGLLFFYLAPILLKRDENPY